MAVIDARSAPPRPPVLLIERALGLGDLLTALPAIRGLAAAYPEHHRVLAVPEALRSLAAASGALDEVVPLEGWDPLPSRFEGVEVAVDLHGRGPQSHRRLLALRPGRLVAFRHAAVPETADGPPWCEDEHERVRWCRLVRSDGVDADPDDLALRPPAGPVPSGARGATLIHPGAKARARRWPAERFAAVARAEAAAGRPVVVTGGSDERDLASEVVARAELPSAAMLAGTTDLAGLARMVAAARRVVCGDTGVAHLATATGTPSVVLFGPTPPSHWGPPSARRDRHRVLWHGSVGDPLSDRTFPGLLGLEVADVLDALAELPA